MLNSLQQSVNLILWVRTLRSQPARMGGCGTKLDEVVESVVGGGSDGPPVMEAAATEAAVDWSAVDWSRPDFGLPKSDLRDRLLSGRQTSYFSAVC